MRGASSVTLLAVAVAACAPAAPHLIERSRVVMGSALQLSAWASDDRAAVEAFDEAFAEFERLENILSIWRPSSDVVRINSAAGSHPVGVRQETIEVLRTALDVSRWSGGKFDVTFGALSEVWKFDHDQDDRVPTAAEIAARLPLVGFEAIEVDEKARTVFLRRRGARIHLGGIGKGYAIDRAAAILRERGVRDFMIQSGGDLYVAGYRDGKPWRLGIRDPRGPADRIFAVLDLSDATFSTSGDYERAFVSNGRRYHHILDPDDGQPARGARSVTIVADEAVLADALSTAVFVLGPIEGLKLVERLPAVEGVVVSASNEVLISSGLRGRVAILAPPTDAP
jgi:thiamine biosynthesis lipoprotein